MNHRESELLLIPESRNYVSQGIAYDEEVRRRLAELRRREIIRNDLLWAKRINWLATAAWVLFLGLCVYFMVRP